MTKEEFQAMMEKLPKSLQMLGREKYFNAAVLVPFVRMDDEYHLLFEKRSAGIRQGGEVCFPGGKHDPEIDKDYEQTAVRETMEELGIPQSTISILGSLGTVISLIGAVIDVFVGTIQMQDLTECRINLEEVEEVFTVPVSFFLEHPPEEYEVRVETHSSYIDEEGKQIHLLPAKELGLPQMYTKPWGKKTEKIYVYKTKYGPIWGITAEIIYELMKQIGIINLY